MKTQGEFYAKDGQIVAQETGKTIALIPYFDNDNEEQKANQNLFAAAPDLLEATEELYNLLEEHLPNWYTRGHYVKAIAAIKKAKGS